MKRTTNKKVFEIFSDVDQLQIYPRVFLGDKNLCKDASFLKANNVTHIVNISSLKNWFESPSTTPKKKTNNKIEDKENISSATIAGKSTKQSPTKVSLQPESSTNTPLIITYMKINIDDSMDVDIRKHFPLATQFVHDVVTKTNGSVMVHCKEGKSRSVSILVAYGMRYMGMSLLQSYENINTITNGRPRINDGFKRQLQEYELELLKQSGISQPENTLDFSPSRRKRKVRSYDENGMVVFVDSAASSLQSPTKRQRITSTNRSNVSNFR
jgi:protein-tyrosine phosphatase